MLNVNIKVKLGLNVKDRFYQLILIGLLTSL